MKLMEILFIVAIIPIAYYLGYKRGRSFIQRQPQK